MGNRFINTSNDANSEISKQTFPYLYTNDNPNEPFLLNSTDCAESSFDSSHLTVILIHGHHDTGTNVWIRKSRYNYFQRSSYNVIVLDWSYFAEKNYFNATKHAPRIAKYMAEILVKLVQTKELIVKNLHIIGHSLGAHLAGFIGKYVYQFLNQKVGRITGLDPAGPLYGKPILVNRTKRLARGDAIFIDVIHTCGGIFGMSQFIGDADFYPNGGVLQPGCNLFDFNGKHFRAALYYTESILNETFISYKCVSWNKYRKGKFSSSEIELMGFSVNTTANGKYFLKTNSKSPFAQGLHIT